MYSPYYAQAPPPRAGGTQLVPGSVVQVGGWFVRVERFLGEGGSALVYLTTLLNSDGLPTATALVLKIVVVPNKQALQEVKKETETMRKLGKHEHIVYFLEASASTAASGFVEVFMLMEWCQHGGVLDLMNRHLEDRLSEGTVLQIMADTVLAVAHMHQRSPPLIHRDLKIENILVSEHKVYKLCDFGSTTTPQRASTRADLEALEHEINLTTTVQYRAPELMNVWASGGFDEKIDIWALGVTLYKLMYYTTPFESSGMAGITTANYSIPNFPPYSKALIDLIPFMLEPDPKRRPNIVQVHRRITQVMGVPPLLSNEFAHAKYDPVKEFVRESIKERSSDPLIIPDSTANYGFVSRKHGAPSSPKPNLLKGQKGGSSFLFGSPRSSPLTSPQFQAQQLPDMGTVSPRPKASELAKRFSNMSINSTRPGRSDSLVDPPGLQFRGAPRSARPNRGDSLDDPPNLIELDEPEGEGRTGPFIQKNAPMDSLDTKLEDRFWLREDSILDPPDFDQWDMPIERVIDDSSSDDELVSRRKVKSNVAKRGIRSPQPPPVNPATKPRLNIGKRNESSHATPRDSPSTSVSAPGVSHVSQIQQPRLNIGKRNESSHATPRDSPSASVSAPGVSHVSQIQQPRVETALPATSPARDSPRVSQLVQQWQSRAV